MKAERIKLQSLKELAEDWGIDYQVFKIKRDLINTIRQYCKEHAITQRKLASMVPGLTQDRVSKIFSGQVGHMTVDKLIHILSALRFRIDVKTKAAA